MVGVEGGVRGGGWWLEIGFHVKKWVQKMCILVKIKGCIG